MSYYQISNSLDPSRAKASKMLTSLNSIKLPGSNNKLLSFQINSSLTERQQRSTSDLIPSEHCKSPISSTPHMFSEEHTVKKPISLAILEKYFSDICQSISAKGHIDPSLLIKAESMHEVLKDCLTAIHNLSLDIYLLMASSLKDIQHIRTSEDQRFQVLLSNKLLQIAAMIEDNNYRSDNEKIVLQEEVKEEFTSVKDLARELNVRVSRVTARILNLWKRIVSVQKEGGVICSCFLLLYCEIDKTIGISPLVRLRADKAVNVMRNYSANPGYVVTILRKTQEYIDKEMVSAESMKRIHDCLGKISAESVRNIDKTLTGFIIYELTLFAVRYYEALMKERYEISVFSQEIEEKQVIGTRFTEKSLGISQSDNFGIVLERSHQKNFSENIHKLSIKPSKTAISSVNPAYTDRPVDIEKFSPKNAFSPKRISPRKTISPQKKKFTSEAKVRPNRISQKPVKSPSKSIDFNITSAKKLLSSTSSSISPLKLTSSVDLTAKSVDHRDVLEEMQYQQFIEEKFRHFLVEKLNLNEKKESRDRNEEKAMKSREVWMEEFENKVGVIRFNAIKKLGDEKRFTAELIRAQRQLQLLEKLT